MSTTRCIAVIAAFLVATLSGCATVTQGTTQAITLHTDPDGAICNVARETKTVASIATTPGQVTVDKAWGAIDITCRKEGHQPVEVKVDSEIQGWTFGNILIGGIIGFAVDAASGAMRQYPQFVTLTLVPEEFGSAQVRDEYFVQRKARFDREAAEALALLNKSCPTCTTEAKTLEDLRDKRLALLCTKVDSARLKPPPAPAASPPPDGDAPKPPG